MINLWLNPSFSIDTSIEGRINVGRGVKIFRLAYIFREHVLIRFVFRATKEVKIARLVQNRWSIVGRNRKMNEELEVVVFKKLLDQLIIYDESSRSLKLE